MIYTGDYGAMIPFPAPLRAPTCEYDRLYLQAYRLCLAAQWTRDERYAAELIEGATVYLQIRRDLFETEAA